MSIVKELQKKALDEKVSVGELLRISIFISAKLGFDDTEWASKELNGYNSGDTLPEYRKVSCYYKPYSDDMLRQLEAVCPSDIHGIDFPYPLCQAVHELEHIYRSSPEEMFSVNLSSGMVGIGNSSFPTVILRRGNVGSIIEIVRNKVLNWSLQLEQNGILGENIDSSPKEKDIAQNVTRSVTNITYVEQMSNSVIQQGTSNSDIYYSGNLDELKEVIEEIIKGIGDLQADEETKAELKTNIATIESQLESPKPKSKILKEGLLSLQRIAEGAVGGVIATGLQSLFQQVFTLLQ